MLALYPHDERVGHPRRRRLVAALNSPRSSARSRAPALVAAELRYEYTTSAGKISLCRDLLAVAAFTRFIDKSTDSCSLSDAVKSANNTSNVQSERKF